MKNNKNTSSNNINFDEGYKEFNINRDPNRVIRFNPSDISIIERAIQAKKEISEEIKKLDEFQIDNNDEEKVAELFKLATSIVKEKINYIFNSDVSDIIFGNQNPLSELENGKTLAQSFLDGAIPLIQAEIEKTQKNSKNKTSKYTERYH